MIGRNYKALTDLHAGLARRWVWMAMATQDIRLRYRGSILGPFWTTLTTAVMIASMGFVYAIIFKMDATTYLPFLTFGLIPWQFISAVVTEGCQTFIMAQSIMHQVRMPLSVHVFRVVYRNLLVVAHSILIAVVVLLLFHIAWGWQTLLLVPACLVLVIDAVALVLVLGMVSARFRDVPPIIANVMQVIFFLTPIFWSPDSLADHRAIADYNPFFAAIDIVRAPLLGQMPAPDSWPMALGTTVVLVIGAFLFFARFRARIVYWV